MRSSLIVGILLAFMTPAISAPLPFNDGRYVVDPELCFLDEDQMVNAYGDQVGQLMRTIEGDTLSDGYELYCQVSDVARAGKRVTFRAVCDSEGESRSVDGDYAFLSEDAFRVYGQVFGRCGSSASISRYRDRMDADSGELRSLYDDANSRCRGGEGGNPRTIGACGERDEYARMLEGRGWCFGEVAEFEYQKIWAPCTASLQISTPAIAAVQPYAEEADEKPVVSGDVGPAPSAAGTTVTNTGDVGDNFTQTLMSKVLLSTCEQGGAPIDAKAFEAVEGVIEKAQFYGLDPEHMTLTSQVLAIDTFFVILPTIPLALAGVDPVDRTRTMEICSGMARLAVMVAPLALSELEAAGR
jgi:hypothetical protein